MSEQGSFRLWLDPDNNMGDFQNIRDLTKIIFFFFFESYIACKNKASDD